MNEWNLHQGDCLELMAGLADKSVDHVITDPPYSEHVHSCGRRGATNYDGDRGRAAISRNRDLGFAHLTAEDMQRLATQYARLSRRWVLVFSDTESAADWRKALESAGLEYIRTLFWHKVGGTPQFTGDRPAVALEAITLCHPKGRKKWNGGGKQGFYSYPIVLNRGRAGQRLHPTQKPLDLMQALVADFTDPGDLVLDSHAGSGTTGEACIALGRRFLGFELDPKHVATATQRLAGAVKQESLFAPVGREQMRLGGLP